jgi:hypothetical protein
MGDIIGFDPSDEVVTLRDIPVPLASDVGRAFISDAARNAEGLLNDGQISGKYGFSIKAWRQLVKTHKALIQAVRSEHERRVRSGLAAQESQPSCLPKRHKSSARSYATKMHRRDIGSRQHANCERRPATAPSARLVPTTGS